MFWDLYYKRLLGIIISHQYFLIVQTNISIIFICKTNTPIHWSCCFQCFFVSFKGSTLEILYKPIFIDKNINLVIPLERRALLLLFITIDLVFRDNYLYLDYMIV